MAWTNISTFLDRFQNIKTPKGIILDEFVEILNKLLGATLFEAKNIDYRGEVLYLKITDASLRNQLFMNKERIIKELKNKLGRRAPKDVRF